MRCEKGFTLVELIIVMAILGILAATAMPLYRTLQQRAYGSEATLMARRILEGQITYFLEKSRFFPGPNYTRGNPIEIFTNTPASDPRIADVRDALNIEIQVGHPLDYILTAVNISGEESFTVSIQAEFPLFRGQRSPGMLIGSVDSTGKVSLVAPP